MQSERKAIIYLKSKDKDNISQLQKELNTLIRQEFTNSKYKEVYDLTTLLIRLGINSVPGKSALLRALEDPQTRLNMS